MKYFSKIFVRGAFTLLPFGLTFIILFSFLAWMEDFSKQALSIIAREFYFPGLGLIIGIAFICLLGFLTTMPFMEKVIATFELPFKNVPILKSVYSAAKSMADFFSPDSKTNEEQQVVVVKFPGFEAELIGFVTRRNLNDMPDEFAKTDRVAVFLPLSYQMGGLTVFIPRAYIRKTNMKVEKAMRSVLTAWMPVREDANT
ncbi:MAG: hypothetical protein A2Z20_06200 [Bdellovibrionales bacterium RBG_16_40_8]|nr:MAG: hypothetical protein A2Z20_06200 [Bdellovibrionales bacterium RBG_16_40_8]